MDSSESTMSMPMYFSTALPVTVAFEGWKISDTSTLVGSCFGVAGIAIVYEIIKKLRQYFWQVYSRRSPYNSLGGKIAPSECDVQSKPGERSQSYGYFWTMHTLNSLIFLTQVFIGYLLMLVVMVYNVWLVVSVIVGLCLGYFCSYFIGVALGYDEMQTNQDSVKSSSVETVDMVISNQGAEKMDLTAADVDSEYGF